MLRNLWSVFPISQGKPHSLQKEGKVREEYLLWQDVTKYFPWDPVTVRILGVCLSLRPDRHETGNVSSWWLQRHDLD